MKSRLSVALIAAPIAMAVANTRLVAEYDDSGLCDTLDPHIAARGFYIKDFGAAS